MKISELEQSSYLLELEKLQRRERQRETRRKEREAFLDVSDHAERECLKCGVKFKSLSKSNRICYLCDVSNKKVYRGAIDGADR